MDAFSPAVNEWFNTTFSGPTRAQELGWQSIAKGQHTLICAPTGSGKTLAAFLSSIDRIMATGSTDGVRVLYISPLRALAVDVEKNLRSPIAGSVIAAERLGEPVHTPTVGVRTGDTSSNERRNMIRNPPDILVTTPESLYLLLTSQARNILAGVETVIIDEIHALAPTKRGAHLAVSMERLERLCANPPQRIGLSATQRPLETVAAYLGGREAGVSRPVTIIDAGVSKELDVEIVVPVEDMAAMGEDIDQSTSLPTDPGPARRSIWPAVHPKILELVREHTSTIVFVNSRRMAERLAGRLNELAEEELVKAHHGSLSREQRTLIEDELKSGVLKGIIATSSLELGIDMGAVDLVILVESPGAVSRGMQRIGRAGHQVGVPSKGKIFPKFRGDLLESAVVLKRMREGLIETTRIPRNPLDVAAQQIVAACAMDDLTRDEIAEILRASEPFANLPDSALDSVLDLLSGHYPSTEFSELRARINWDRRTNVLSGRPGAQRVAVTNAGTIPDRGLFGVFTPDGGRVGELDEEMVYESRPGEAFQLGASTWRIDDITHDRVIVTPAPGQPAKMPFWHGDRPGRPIELGRGLGEFTRQIAENKSASEWLTGEVGLDEFAANNLISYVDEQRHATGAVPDDRTIVVERFRDEIGDWRVCILTPFGGQVHAPWALAIEERLTETTGLAQVLWSDDGIILRLTESMDRVPLEEILIDPAAVEELVTRALPNSALFASRFREAAGRSLLLPRRNPKGRSPLWQQRMRSANLMGVASGYPQFPLLLETTRECLSDVFDLNALKELLTEIQSRKIRVVTVDTETSSPFAQSLVFGWIAAYMYEGDNPLAEQRAAALALDRDLLRELLGTDELRDLLDGNEILRTELELQRLADGRRARNHDELHDLLRAVGDLTAVEADARCEGDPTPWIADLKQARRITVIRIGSEDRLIAAEDAGRYRDALGCRLEPGLPRAFTEPVTEALPELVSRYARTHGPFTTAEVGARFGLAFDRAESAINSLEAVTRGQFRPSGSGWEWCHNDVLSVIRRRSLAAARREVEPVDASALVRFSCLWHGLTPESRLKGPDPLADVIGSLSGAALPASTLEREILPSRIPGYSPSDLDALISSGDVIWVGAGGIGSRDGRVKLAFRAEAPTVVAAPADPVTSPLHDALRERLERGACFWLDLLAASTGAVAGEVVAALWDLVWAGEVTNDSFAAVRAFVNSKPSKSNPRARRPRPGRLTAAGPPAAAGRWSLTRDLLVGETTPTEILHARAWQLLERHGVLTREAVGSESIPGGFSGVYPVLKVLEESGKVRRGWFVDGLGASQFALPGAVDRLRSLRDAGQVPPLVIAATDPANPYGAAIDWPDTEGRPARSAGAQVVIVDGSVHAWIEGKSVVTFTENHSEWTSALANSERAYEISKVNSVSVHDSPEVKAALTEAGFAESYRGFKTPRK